MVFSTDNLIREQENIIDNAPISNKISIKVNENSSLFINTLHYILEENLLIENELVKYNIPTYTNKKLLSLNENPIADALKRGININVNFGIKDGISNLYQKVKTNFSIESIISFIVKSFCKLITRIWREFEIICMNLVTKNSQIKRLSKKINDIGVDIIYNPPMFTYTHIMDDTNRAELEEELKSIYKEFTDFLFNFEKTRNTESDIEALKNKFNESKSNDEEYFNFLRGKQLGLNSAIYEEDYNEMLFKYFRNDSSTATIDNVITPASIRERYKKWEKMPKIIKAYTRDHDKLERAANDLENNVKSSRIDNRLTEVPSTELDLYSNLINRYAHKIKDTCNIFLLFYSQKLDAAKDELTLNTKILFRAATYIVKEGL